MLENDLKEEADLVCTRAKSVTSSISNLSWTRNISTASTSSTLVTVQSVSSFDFVTYDHRVPFVPVESIHGRVKRLEDNLESSSSSSYSKKSKPSSPSAYDGSVGNPHLNLSTSSLTDVSTQPGGAITNAELMSLELRKLTKSLNLFYEEINKWGLVESDDCDNDCDIFSIISEATKGISEFNNILDNDDFKINEKASPDNRNVETVREVVPDCNGIGFSCESGEGRSPDQTAALQGSNDEVSDPYGALSTTSSDKSLETEKSPINTRDNFAIPIKPKENPPSMVNRSSGSSETFTSDNYNYLSFEDRVCEDEDALSLFAESFSGMESSRLSVASSAQERNIPTPYVPEPMKPLLCERYTYRPTRISSDPQNEENVPLTAQSNMVEQQNVHSSSICNGTNINQKAVSLIQRANQLAQPECVGIQVDAPNRPMRLFSRYQPAKPLKSSLYKRYCFYYLTSQCKNMNCGFHHTHIDTNTFMSRLSMLSENKLIEEYLLTRHYPKLRWVYCLPIMKECIRRSATRLLMEMAIDIGLGVVEQHPERNVEALEAALLHLNDISFDACDDLLQFTHNGLAMCDAFLIRMANSMNFAQFESAFVKLAYFMTQTKRPVRMNIVSNILERVCILPCDENLARGMLCLMKNTDPRIFDNAMICSFEVQLSNLDSNVLKDYWNVKNEAIRSVVQSGALTLASASAAVPLQPLLSLHTSPDTTPYENMVSFCF